MIRRFYPGTEPGRLTLRQFNGLCLTMGEIAGLEHGEKDHRASVERRAAARERMEAELDLG